MKSSLRLAWASQRNDALGQERTVLTKIESWAPEKYRRSTSRSGQARFFPLLRRRTSAAEARAVPLGLTANPA